MIHYALRCAGGHDFDGWFPGSDGFEAQRAEVERRMADLRLRLRAFEAAAYFPRCRSKKRQMTS